MPSHHAATPWQGGIVEPVFDENGEPAGPARVWYLAQVAPGLAMARSIGDAVGAMVGVIAEPEITNRALRPEDALCIIASDGLWEFLSSEQAAAVTLSTVTLVTVTPPRSRRRAARHKHL